MEIDGSYGEGGGQIVRTAVALAAVTGTSIRVSKIRLGSQSLVLLSSMLRQFLALAGICSAKTAGILPDLQISPLSPVGSRVEAIRVDIGTAGSITLLGQCLLPAMIRADGPITLKVTGGTDVRWSPTIDYFKSVFLPALREFGARVEVESARRGYYPRGGGSVVLTVTPGSLKPAHLEPRESGIVEGISHCS